MKKSITENKGNKSKAMPFNLNLGNKKESYRKINRWIEEWKILGMP
jgi:hypothetical protein